MLGLIRHASSHDQRNASSERAQEVQNVLLLGIRDPVETLDHAVCLGTRALMRGDGLQQILRPPVMQEKDSLTKTPDFEVADTEGDGYIGFSEFIIWWKS